MSTIKRMSTIKITPKKESSYANVKAAITEYHASPTPTSRQVRSTASETKPVTPAQNTQVSTIQPGNLPQTQPSNSSLSSKPGGWGNIIAVYKSIFFGDGVTANVKNPLLKASLETAAEHPFITAGLGTLGYMALTGAFTATGVTATTTGVTATGSGLLAGNTLLNTAIIGGAGLGAGFLLGRNGGSTGPQNLNQAQTPTQTANPTQTPTLYDYSQRNSTIRNDTWNRITDSPGASISSSQAATPNLSSSFNPNQAIGQGQTLDQAGSQAATAGGDLLLPALAIAAAVLFSRR